MLLLLVFNVDDVDVDDGADVAGGAGAIVVVADVEEFDIDHDLKLSLLVDADEARSIIDGDLVGLRIALKIDRICCNLSNSVHQCLQPTFFSASLLKIIEIINKYIHPKTQLTWHSLQAIVKRVVD